MLLLLRIHHEQSIEVSDCYLSRIQTIKQRDISDIHIVLIRVSELSRRQTQLQSSRNQRVTMSQGWGIELWDKYREVCQVVR